jgi:hypothetical protein
VRAVSRGDGGNEHALRHPNPDARVHRAMVRVHAAMVVQAHLGGVSNRLALRVAGNDDGRRIGQPLGASLGPPGARVPVVSLLHVTSWAFGDWGPRADGPHTV